MCFKHWGYASEGFKFRDFLFLFSFGASILKCGDQKRVDLIFQKSGRPDSRPEKKFLPPFTIIMHETIYLARLVHKTG